MAEALVKFFLQRLSSLKLQENEASPGLQDKIQKLKNRLEEIISFPGDIGSTSKQEDGLVCNWLGNLIETLHDAENCINEYVAKARNQDGSDQVLSIVQFCGKLEKINAHLAEILRQRSQLIMPPTWEAKKEIGQSSSSGDGVDVVGEESLAPFALNYRNLPSYLRSCLIHCSLFPEKTSRGRLVRLLVAEGNLQEKPGEVMEDIAEENINELVGQGMLRVKIGFKDKLKVVDPYHKICLLKLQRGYSISQSLFCDSNFPQSSSIVVIHHHGETIMTSSSDHPIGSLYVFSCNEGIPDNHWAFHNFKILRVLEIEDVKIKSLPEEIGDLIHLRYLGLKHSALYEIPKSIGNLQNLQTLDIRWPRSLRGLPSGVLNLQHLRHLMLPVNEIKVPSGISILTNLQSLTGLFIRHGFIKELGSLTLLRKLELMDVSEEHASQLSASIMKMTGLLSLSLHTRGYGKDELLPTLEPFSPLTSIRKLCLEGRLMGLSNWVCSMENLTKLRLGFSFLSEEEISLLQFLPNLKHLTLWRACEAKVINKEFSRVGGFPKLEIFIIASPYLLEWTEIEKGALPSLAFLCFHSCSRLRNLPEGLQYVSTLKVLEILPLHPDLERRLKLDGGKENYKIKHIPQIQFFSSFLRTWVAM
ncbi:putative disease resistance protein At1g58400 [Macadamia integrifolia]|uniref:putative disease resistance protein At1g58400 n=1 Tax=Macadamia integrifolia TaxID=60698 RepID=UPI001C4FDF1E|nr:putative disease resistance protein At1g58400 [Macadamia integrifolia]XP_042497433.1 putative disease resistance protein At1g58400 [Macadamia integrifolia]